MTISCARSLIAAVTLWSGSLLAETPLERILSDPNQALGLDPNDSGVLMSYHPGRVSVLALLSTDGRRVVGLYATELRGRFLTRWQSEDSLLAAFVPEDACSRDAGLVRIALSVARRTHNMQFSSSRTSLRSGDVDLSINEVVNRQIPTLLEAWGKLDRRRWPGVEVIDLPAGSCPQRWAGGQLQLSTDSDELLLLDPDDSEPSPASGRGWLFDSAGNLRARLDVDGSTLYAGKWTIDLGAFSNPILLGLTSHEDPLIALSNADSVKHAVYRHRDGDLELYFEDSEQSVNRATLNADNDRVISLDFAAPDGRRFFLDHRISALLRNLDREIGGEHSLIDESRDRSTSLSQGLDAYWLWDTGTDQAHRLEARRPWLSTDRERAMGDDLPSTRAVLASPTALAWSETEAFRMLGVKIDLGQSTSAISTCQLIRRSLADVSETEIRCDQRTRSWASRLASESDAERSRRIRAMAEFVQLGGANP